MRTIAVLMLMVSAIHAALFAQSNANQAFAVGTVQALLVSDIHFDPFHDPAKVKLLVDAPVSRWADILSGAPSPDQAQTFADLQETCHARGVDTPYSLLKSSLTAMHKQQPDAKFITVSGDLIAHAFDCRFARLVSGFPKTAYEDFVLKTISFLESETRKSFPGIPIYFALGNNDTPCGDYSLDPDSDFLVRTGRILAEGLPIDEQGLLTEQFRHFGAYSLTMAAPMAHTRLVVLNDVYMSPKYKKCDGRTDPAAANAEIAWLRDQLIQAEHAKQNVWVMGHIPPGVDSFSTVAKMKDICGHDNALMFLSSDALANTLGEHAGAVRLAIFGHTHMDELRLLESDTAELSVAEKSAVAIKIVPSISPVDGNNPSFIAARVNPTTAMLVDYQVIEASNQTGNATTWSKEYDYAETYHEAKYSPAALKHLVSGFATDGGARAPASQAYIRDFFVGDRSPALTPVWPPYVCALSHADAAGFAACVCSTSK